MNTKIMQQQLSGTGPFLIRTSDGKELKVPHADFVLIGRHNLVIEHANGFLDIIDPLHVVSIRPNGKRKAGKSRN